MSVELRCVSCWNPLQEGDLVQIRHTDGTPENGRHIADGIHPHCLRDWVSERYRLDRPITCPLGCQDKLIHEQVVLSERELRNAMPRRLVGRAVNWLQERLEPPENREILALTSIASGSAAMVGQMVTQGMTSLVGSFSDQEILTSGTFYLGTGLSFVSGATLGATAGLAFSGQGLEGLRLRRIDRLAEVTAIAGAALGLAITQTMLNG